MVDGAQAPTILGCKMQFFAYTTDMGIHCTGVYIGLITPDTGKNLVARQQTTNVIKDVQGQFEFLVGQLDGLSFEAQATTLWINLVRPNFDDLLWRSLACSPRNSRDTCQEFRPTDGLGDVIVRAFIENPHHIVLSGARGHKNHRGFPVLLTLKPGQNLLPIDLRHYPIEQHSAKLFITDFAGKILAIIVSHAGVPLLLQPKAEQG